MEYEKIIAIKSLQRLKENGVIINKRIDFSDGEFMSELNISKSDIENKDILIIGSTDNEDSKNLMELLQVIRIVSSNFGRPHVIIPYFGWARQDRTDGKMTCVTAKLIADMIKVSGAKTVKTFDVHLPQIESFFDIPFENVDKKDIFIEKIKNDMKELDSPVICSPDAGSFKMGFEFSKLLEIPQVSLNKLRLEANKIAEMQIFGNVENKDVIIIDDMLDTGGTLCRTAKFLKESGANKVLAYATHGVLSGKAFENLNNSEIDKLTITNSINKDLSDLKIKFEVIDIFKKI